MKVSTPVLGLMLNLAWSAPPTRVKVKAVSSSSSTVTVVTAVSFSATLIPAVAPPPLLVMSGTSLNVVKFQYVLLVTASEPTPDALTMPASIST